MLIVACLFTFTGAIKVQAQCHSSPNLSTLDKDFFNYLHNLAQKPQERVATLPFLQNTAGVSDSVFKNGIPYHLYQSFSGSNPNFIHPYVSQGIQADSSKDYKKLAEQLKTRYILYGEYQVSDKGSIRIHLGLYDSRSNSHLSPVENFETPLDDSLLSKLITHTHKAFERLKSAKKLKPAAQSFQPKLQSFRYMTKGLNLANSYQSNRLELAAVWIEKALKAGYHDYPFASLESARILFMQALLKKFKTIDYSRLWSEALEKLKSAQKSFKKDTHPLLIIANRYVLAQNLQIQGITALNQNKNKEAGEAFLQLLNLVPEDALVQGLFIKTSYDASKQKPSLKNALCL